MKPLRKLLLKSEAVRQYVINYRDRQKEARRKANLEYVIFRNGKTIR